MTQGDLKISRWLLTPEMLLCFAPLSLYWLDGIDGRSGLLRLNGALIQQAFIGMPGGMVFLSTLLSGVALASIGPIALVAAFRMIVWGRPVRNSGLRVMLLAAPILYGVMALVSRTVEVGGTAAFDVAASDAFDFWSGIFLLSVLRAFGAAHLLRLSPTSPVHPA